jgi:hypothetical protein
MDWTPEVRIGTLATKTAKVYITVANWFESILLQEACNFKIWPKMYISFELRLSKTILVDWLS